MAEPFNHQKMKWLNSIFYSSKLTATACRVAYVIGDHVNRVTRDCWLSQATIATKLGLSTKTIQRAILSLRRHDFVRIRYVGKSGRKQRFVPVVYELDNYGSASSQKRPIQADRSVHQTYLGNLQKSYLGTGERDLYTGEKSRPVRQTNRGLLEREIARRLGNDGWDLLSKLAEIDDGIVARLCHAQAAGALSASDLTAARLAARQAR